MPNIRLPIEVKFILDTLESYGHEAFVVGGCIRDCLMGKIPNDWDICTSAIPSEIVDIFSEHSIIQTGIRHGSVTLMINLQMLATTHNGLEGRKKYDITTYRKESNYIDNRHPDSVEFIAEIKQDLARRDFTINALAFNPRTGIVDYFNGILDIQKHIIKAIGNADERFTEDALRILRALRFASTLEFKIDIDTDSAIFKNKNLLHNLSAERVANELNKLLLGDGAGKVINQYLFVIDEVLPDLVPIKRFSEKHFYNRTDILSHTLNSLDFASKNLIIRLVILFHDSGIPFCHLKKNCTSHLNEHSKMSERIAFKTLSKLKYDTNTIKIVSELILYHNVTILPEKKDIKRWLSRLGEDKFRQLLEVKKAISLTYSLFTQENVVFLYETINGLFIEILDQKLCFSLKDLAINGKDLVSIGIPEGVEIGQILKQLLDKVIDDEIENNYDILIKAAQKHVF